MGTFSVHNFHVQTSRQSLAQSRRSVYRLRKSLIVPKAGPEPPGVSADLIVKEPSEERQEELVSEGRCKTCGVPKNEIPWGCNQEGRVAGGLGAVVGFEWWPIKAYKPCGKAAKAGVLYTRKGQITDEMLFGPRDQNR